MTARIHGATATTTISGPETTVVTTVTGGETSGMVGATSGMTIGTAGESGTRVGRTMTGVARRAIGMSRGGGVSLRDEIGGETKTREWINIGREMHPLSMITGRRGGDSIERSSLCAWATSTCIESSIIYAYAC